MEINTPAHVTAKKALGITDPQEAKDAFVKAIQDKDDGRAGQDLRVLEHRLRLHQDA